MTDIGDSLSAAANNLNFEEEYLKRCESLKLEPFQIRRLPYPPPGYPHPKESNGTTITQQKSGTADSFSAPAPGPESNGGKSANILSTPASTAATAKAGGIATATKKKTDGSTVSSNNPSQQINANSSKDKDGNDQLGLAAQPPSGSKYKLEPTILLENGQENGADNHTIYRLQIRGWELSRSMMEAIAGTLHLCGTITHLTLWNCGIKEEYVTQYLANLVEHSSIINLAIENSPLSTENNPRGNEAFALLIRPESRLQFLTLRRNGITSADLLPLSTHLKTNRNLLSLDLYQNLIGAEGGRYLANALKLNQALRSLSLGNNFLYDEGARYFSETFSKYPITAEELALRKQISISEAKREEERSNSRRSIENLAQKTAAPTGKKGATAAKATAKKDEAPAKAAPGQRQPAAGAASQSKKQDEKVGKAAGAQSAANAAKDKQTSSLPTKNAAPRAVPKIDPMALVFEFTGLTYSWGNRSLCNFNLSSNYITDEGAKLIYDSLLEQDLAGEMLLDGQTGVIRLSLQGNLKIDRETFDLIETLLHTRNPFLNGGIIRYQPKSDDAANALNEGDMNKSMNELKQ